MQSKTFSCRSKTKQKSLELSKQPVKSKKFHHILEFKIKKTNRSYYAPNNSPWLESHFFLLCYSFCFHVDWDKKKSLINKIQCSSQKNLKVSVSLPITNFCLTNKIMREWEHAIYNRPFIGFFFKKKSQKFEIFF